MLSFVHTDQAPNKNYFWCVQGLVNLMENGDEDGGLVIIPKTHTKHQKFFKKLKQEKGTSDWYLFSDKEKEDEIFEGAIKICGEAGDFMMWDSRTFHCNTIPTSPKIGRACVYICQIPKSKVNEKTRAKRKNAWEKRRCTSHYPGNDSFKMFPVLPRHAS